MAIKLFILGRPGSGKSTAFRYIAERIEQQYPGWSTIRFTDYDILQEMFRAEVLFRVDPKRRKFCSVDHGGFDVVDFSVLDIALKELEKQVLRRYSTKDDLIIIEFARDDYAKALKLFKSSFLQNAYFLFIDADVDLCIRRIHERVAHPVSEDDHFVSEDILKRYYNKQSLPFNLTNYSIDPNRIKVINSKGLEDRFAARVNRFTDNIIKQETRAMIPISAPKIRVSEPWLHGHILAPASELTTRVVTLLKVGHI